MKKYKIVEMEIVEKIVLVEKTKNSGWKNIWVSGRPAFNFFFDFCFFVRTSGRIRGCYNVTLSLLPQCFYIIFYKIVRRADHRAVAITD